MQLSLPIAMSALAVLASTSAAPAAAGQQADTRHLRRACKAKSLQNNNQVKPTTAAPTAAAPTSTTAMDTASAAAATSATATPAASSAPAGSTGGGDAPDSDIGGMLKLHNDFRSHYGTLLLTLRCGNEANGAHDPKTASTWTGSGS